MEIQPFAETLKNHPLFKDLEETYITTLAECASEVQFTKGTTVFRAQEKADTFYLLKSGRIAVDLVSGENNPLTIQTVGKGNILGWSWIFAPYLWQFDARALEDTDGVVFDARCIRGKIEEDKALGYEMMQRFSHILLDRLQATRMQLLDIYGPGGK